MIGGVVIATYCDFVVLQPDFLHSVWIGAGIDSQATGCLLTTLSNHAGLAVVEDQVVFDDDFDSFACGLLDNEAVDAVVKCLVIVQMELTCVVAIACEDDSGAVNDVRLIPSAVLVRVGAALLWHVDHEEGHEVSIAVDYVSI